VGWDFVSAGLVPEGEFHPVPESKLVIDDSEIVLDDVFGSSDGIGNFPVFESLSNELDDALLPFAGCAFSVSFEHICLRYKRVASFTRLIPLLIPKRKKRRLK